MLKSFTRARWIAVGLVLGAVVALFAQEPAVFQRGLIILRGNLDLSGSAGNSVCFEGSTADANETCFRVTDPTADRTFTFGNASNTVVGWTLTTPTITGAAMTETVTAAGGTETLDSTDCGQTILLDTASGSVVTLPAATGSGCVYKFLVTVTNTSNDHSIVVVGDDEFVGGLISVGTTADNSDAFTAADAGDVDAIQMNGTTEGGVLGTLIIVTDISADNWGLAGTVISTDASATMLATGVVS